MPSDSTPLSATFPAPPAEITFVVPGHRELGPGGASLAGGTRGALKAAVQVASQRGTGEAARVSARPGEDLVELVIDNGPTLVLHPENARDLMLAQAAGDTRGGIDPAKAAATGEVAVPAQLGWPAIETAAGPGDTNRSGGPGATRGVFGRVLLRALNVLSGGAEEAGVSFAQAAATKKLDGQVDEGLYALAAEGELLPLKGRVPKLNAVAAADGPLLVLVHGTFSDTAGTFSQLWSRHPDLVRRLFDRHAGRVFGLDHRTMAASPIANAATLVRALPEGAVLHLLTHSRGGLVAETLARACASPAGDGALDVFEVDDRGQPTDAYADERDALKALIAEARAKRIRVERVVRVACPSRGTLLASRRLDAYLSVLKWSLELARLPVLPALVEFLGEVARRRADPSELPGLEAMMPGSALVRWLNADAGQPIEGALDVIAGDCQGDSVRSWVKTLLADAFYWTDNDLVVQTRSMYGGAPRAGSGGGSPAARFVLDRGGEVSHFNYFANARTAAAITAALAGGSGGAAEAAATAEAAEAGFRPIGPLSWAGESGEGTRAARAVARSRGADADGRPASARPAVFVLPGILGSNLAVDGERVWLGVHFVNGLGRLRWDPATASHVTPDGPIGSVYDGLIESFAATHEVIPFAFDWRRPVEDEARRLADAVSAALDARDESGQPVRIVAHSMGGLVARTMRLERPEVWRRMMAKDGARLLMLGTPNGGSWSPMQVLSGDDSFGNMLSAFGALFQDRSARAWMAGMPGFIQLQAGLNDPALRLDTAAEWQRLADEDLKQVTRYNLWHVSDNDRMLDVYRWSAPPADVLAQAVALRERLDAQLGDLGADAQKMLLVVGRVRWTPDGCSMSERGLEYVDIENVGDGRVTHASARIAGVKTWLCPVSHGDLAEKPDGYAAYAELLQRGETALLQRFDAPAGRAAGIAGTAAAPATRRGRPSRMPQVFEPPATPDDLYAERAEAGAAAGAQALPVAVANGSLKFVREPLMLGHYEATEVTGTERLVNRLIGGSMTDALKAGFYPNAVGSAQVFVNLRRESDEPFQLPRPAAVVVVGLGEEGRLKLSALALTVCQGVIAYAQRRNEQGTGPFELAATLMGSGGTGISTGSAAQAIAQGVWEANRRLAQSGWPTVSQLRLVELYLDRASDAHHALAVLAASRSRDFSLAPAVEADIGALRRPPDSGYRGADYDFVTVTQTFDASRQPRLEYTLDTQRARSEVRGQATQGPLVEQLVSAGAASDSTDARIGRSLFQLLVPLELRPFMSGSTSIVLQLDRDAAHYPWELLDAGADADAGGSGDGTPWAVRTRMIRKLRTEDFRERPRSAGADAAALVIGEPQVDPKRFARLPGARAEAGAVAEQLGEWQPELLLGPDAMAAVNALLAKPLRIVHISGHGELREDGGGVVLSDGAVIGANEVKAMCRVPELVFVNCCFIGQIGSAEAAAGVPRNALGAKRARFASGVAESLIEIGVRCVVAAGWAVEDEPACAFAVAFYRELLNGAKFIDAVGTARQKAWEANPAGNTWAAYQCYGDPDWRLREIGAASSTRQDSSIVSAPALALALETLAAGARYEDHGVSQPEAAARSQARTEALAQLERRYGTRWGDCGAVAEAFGLAHAENDAGGDGSAGDAAVDWYRKAIAADDGSASFGAAERLADLLSFRAATRLGSPPGADAATPRAQARADIVEAIAMLEPLAHNSPTARRANLMCATYRRLAMLEDEESRPARAEAALEKAVPHCEEAERRAAAAADAAEGHAAGLARIAIALRQAAVAGRRPRLDGSRLAALKHSLESRAANAPDFACVVGLRLLRLFEAMGEGRLAAVQPALDAELREFKERASAPSLWRPFAEQLRFVLEPYAKQGAGSAAERSAAQALRATAEGFVEAG